MKLTVSLNGHSFGAEVDTAEGIAAIQTLFRSWLNAQEQAAKDAATIESVTEQLRGNTNALQQAVNASTPKE